MSAIELILANNSSYPRIGDSSEYQLLRRTVAQWERGEKTDADLRAAEDRMTDLALREQIEAGLDLVTDGQIRWYDPISHLAGKLQGVRINGLLRLFDTNFYFRQPVVQSRPVRMKPLIFEEYLYAKAKSSRPVKPVLTGPGTLARLSVAEAGTGVRFGEIFDGYAEALAAEVAALAASGARVIQVDEPALLRHLEDFAQIEQGLKLIAARKRSAELALTVYFADAASHLEKLQRLPVDILGLDFTYSPRLGDTVAAGGSAKRLALGLVDGRNTRLEDPTAVARQLERIAPALSPQPAYLTPSCGLEYLPRDRAQLKLRHLSTIRKTFLGSTA